MKFIFKNLKNRAYKIDMSPDSHKIDMKIENTEEAFNFFDEISVFKTSAIFEYINHINEEKFKDLLKKMLNIGIHQTNNKIILDRKIIYKELYNLKFQNKDKHEFLELKLGKVFEVLTENKGVIKIETVKIFKFLGYFKINVYI